MKSVTILGRKYVVLVKPMNKKLYGTCKGIAGQITINEKHKDKGSTLVHETLHAILHESGMTKLLDEHNGLEEALCTTLEGGLMRSGLIRNDLFA